MRAMWLIVAACLLGGCLSTAREREMHCLAATMMDVWQTEQELTTAEQVWRTAQQARSEPAPSWDASTHSFLVAGEPAVGKHPAAASRGFPFSSFRSEKEARLYQHIVVARARHGEASKWHHALERRVQTRMEEDDMLYPVLGMLATSTAIIVYPLVRWNVRSVLWDGTDPDAEDDPVQRFCAARLEGGETAAR